jgi:hypothetical protein
MVEAFATADDLATRLNREFTEDEEAWVTALLEDASTYLRGVIGQQVFPRATVTFQDWPSARRIDLPQWPVVAVSAVARDGDPVDYTLRPGYIVLDDWCDDPVDVTFTFGYEEAPDELRRLACVLVSSALLTLESDLGLTAGGLSSAALDDLRLAWADGGASSGMVLPPIQEAAVRRQFGRGDLTVVDVR